MVDTQAIKAELYDLESHNCNGRLILNADGRPYNGDRPCSGCSRVLELQPPTPVN